MRPLTLEQSDTMNRNKTENETTKTRSIRYNEQQQKRELKREQSNTAKQRMKPLKREQSDATKQRMRPLKQSDTTNSNKTKNETTKTRTIRCIEQQQNRE